MGPVRGNSREPHPPRVWAVVLGLAVLNAACGDEAGRAKGAETVAEAVPPVAEPSKEPSAQEQRDGYKASAPEQDGERRVRYGRALADGTQEVALTELLSAPKKYADSTVRTSGVVARVCKAMGCWMELRAAGNADSDTGATLRAPMAGHAFFLPQDAVGKPATIEGPVRLAPLTDAQKAHYRAEGMQAVDQIASIDAEAVVIGAP
ncbi:MAG: DUF4920 domain-containing protein [Myxococcales bacterium]|nr:DUF4920 domain-containing protein [Myxococcales bacterium]MDD9966120.1 DUF4920 domain-containing protein [Myxococcales bacterium]